MHFRKQIKKLNAVLEMETVEEVGRFGFGHVLVIFMEKFCPVLAGGVKFFGGSCA